MRISDWSSDVCSSDLVTVVQAAAISEQNILQGVIDARARATSINITTRSEERRVGKVCVSTCRSRWSPAHEKNNQTTPSIPKLITLSSNHSISRHNHPQSETRHNTHHQHYTPH